MSEESTETKADNQAPIAPPETPPPEVLADAKAVPDDPAGRGVFAATSSVLILERDGVTVRGAIDPTSGDGVKPLLERLKADLLLSRAGLPVPPEPPLALIVGEHKAEAAGHEPDPVTGRCIKCGIARWAQLSGHPCEPRVFDAPGAQEPVVQAAAG